MKEILLTRGKKALVDDADFERLNKHKWQAVWDGGHWYAMHTVRDNGKTHTIYMAREIMGAQPGEIVDHRENEATLNNQRDNLRICTHSQNQMNRKKRAGCSSRYKGVYWREDVGKWRVYIWAHGKQIALGHFDKEKEDDAGRVYNMAAILHFGEFAHLNVIGGAE